MLRSNQLSYHAFFATAKISFAPKKRNLLSWIFLLWYKSNTQMSDPRLSIRPEVTTEDIESTEAERLQNATLRPVLKMQNDLLVAIFRHFMDKRKIKFDGLSPQQQEKQIEHSVSKDKRLRFQLLGAVIGQFTTEEYAAYLQIEREAVRRISTMLTERLKEQLC
jgi:hypothetical protein